MSAPERDPVFQRLAHRLAALREALDAVPEENDRRIARDALRDALDRDGEPRLGTAIVAGSFAVLHPLHQGAHFEILALRQRDLGTPHALKAPRADRGSDPLLRRLILAEASIQARIDHPACLPLRAVLRLADGRPAILTDHLAAPTLAERLAVRPLRTCEAAALGLRLAEALGAVHAAGFVHGDVTPGNVFLPQEDAGQAMLFDFGLSRPIGRCGDADLDMACSPAFAAPEAQSPETPAHPAADLFSLGRVVSAALPEPATGDLGALLADLVKSEPGSRPASALHVAERFERCGANTTTYAKR